MATYSNSGPTPEPLSHEPRGKLVEYEQFIEDQLRKTRSHVRSVDIAGSLMLLAAATLGYLFLAALVDHWMVPGGLGFWGRMLFFIAYLGGAGYFLGTQVLPLLVRRINPVYAAHTIERSGPTLKNSLINFLLFRENPTGVNNVVFEAIEEQAATRLAKVQVESAVDRTKLIRIGYALLGILLVCALYTLISPKNLLQTVGRVAMPWADIAPPTRTTIAEIEPGNAEAFRGQQVTVKARVQGLRDAGPVTLFYTTADRQIVDRAVEMQLPTDGYKHEIILPAGDSSLQQSLTYRIEAGDAISKTYTIEVVAAPTIVVQSVEYKYPSYTGLLPQRIEHQGDLKAIEGTEVTLHALANQEIDSAHIDFNCDNKLNTRMRSEGTQASVAFRLLLKEDRQTPEHDCYQVIFKNPQGQQNPKPVRHQIEVTRDLAPEIQFVAPQRDEIDLPANGQVELELVAADPDFALRRVQLTAQVAGQSALETNLLDSAWRGQWVHKYRFEPAKLKLKSGDVVEYWAVAEDNKDPEPNRTQAARRRIRIVSPSDNGQQDQLAQNDPQNQGQGQPGEGGEPGDNAQARDDQAPRDPNDQQNQKPQEDQQQGEPGGQQRQDQQAQDGQQQQEQPGEQGQGEQGQGEQQPGQGQQQPGEQGGGGDAADERPSSVPNDGTNDGDAIERILEHRNEQQKSDPGQQEKQQQGGQQGNQQQQDKQQQPDQGGERREQQQNQKQPGQESEDQREQGDGQQSGDQQGQQGNAQRQEGTQQQRGGEQQRQQSGDQQQPKQGEQQQQRGQENQAQDKQGQGDQDQGNQGQEKQPQQPQGGQQGKGKSGQQKPGEQGQGGEQQGEGNQQDGQQGQRGQQRDQQGQKSGQRSNSKDRAQGQSEATDEQPDENTPVEDAAPGDRPPQGKGRPTDRQPSGQKPQAGDQSPDSNAQGKPQPGEKSDAERDKSRNQRDPSATRDGQEKPAHPGDETATDRQQGQRGDDKQPQGAEKPSQSGDSDASDAKDARDTKGQGAQSKSDPTRDPSKSGDKPQGEQRPDARGGDGEQEKGKSGAGQGSKEDAGSPTPQEQAQPRDKASRPKADNEEQPPEGPEQSPSTSKRESDSEGGDDGDRSGGGKRGGGQKADKPGTGGAGENTAADQGAGQSEQSGDGEAAERAGDKRASDNTAGKPGSEKGEGTQRRPAAGPDAQPGEGGEPQPDQPGGKDGQSAQGQPGGDQSGSQAQTPSGGKPGDSRPAEQQWKPGQDAADEANLDYARKSTDLALEHLKDQLKRDEPDQALLDKLGWTRDDLQNFVRRWEKMRGSAQAPGDKGAEGKRELDETLRSLGLKPRATSIKSAGQSDRVQGLRESRRTSPPPEYAEQYKAYTQGTARGK